MFVCRFQSDLPSGSEVIEVEEDNTINVGGEGYKVLIDNGTQDNIEKRKGRWMKIRCLFKSCPAEPRYALPLQTV